MEYLAYFDNDNQKIDRCAGQVYLDFLEYAFSRTDYFMLVYINYYGNGYTKAMREISRVLKPFRVKRRTNPSWPGTLGTFSRNTTYKIVFYKNCVEAKKVLQHVTKMSDWSCPHYPQDLAFFQGNKCWFYSVGHEKIGGVIRATPEDITFLVDIGLIKENEAHVRTREDDLYFSQYDEIIDNVRDHTE